MINLEITVLGVALALDAGIVSFALALMLNHELFHKKLIKFSLLSLLFGSFQGLIMWLGSRLGEFITFSYLGPAFLYLVAMIFFVISFKLFSETLKKEEIKNLSWKPTYVVMLAFATSIDAFAAGMSLATMPRNHISSAWVGVITVFICFLFSLSSFFLKRIPEKWLLRFGATIFLLLGLEIVVKQFK